VSGAGNADEPDPARRDAIEESLNEALSDLERMLQRHRDGGESAPPEPTDDGEQFTIPLLDEVVVPGVPVPDIDLADGSSEDDVPLVDDEPALRRRLAARLASEIEVIVQDRMEAALAQAREEIREQVRNHMDIILPEIVDELTQAKRRSGGE
jgi:hypothetical protein